MRVWRRSVVAVCAVALAGATSPAVASGGQTLIITVTNPDGGPAAGVALFIPGESLPATFSEVVVDQRGEAFVPIVSVVPTGGVVQFTNSDPTSHHVYSFSKSNAFALPLYKGQGRLSNRFMHAGVVVLGCNIHDAMLGYIVVVDSSRAGVTGADGRLTLRDVPAGRHVIRAWAPGLDRTSPPEIGAVEVGSTTVQATFQLATLAGAKPAKRSGSLAGGDY